MYRCKSNQPRPQGTRFAEQSEGTDRHFTGAAFDVLDVVRALAKEKGCTPSQIALAWVAQQPAITGPIIGPRTMEQLEDYLGALTVKFSAEDLARIDKVAPPGRAIVPYYDADFGPHRYRW